MFRRRRHVPFGFVFLLVGCLGTPPVNVVPSTDASGPVDIADNDGAERDASETNHEVDTTPGSAGDIEDGADTVEVVAPEPDAQDIEDVQVTEITDEDVVAPSGCSLASLAATVGCGPISGGYDVWGATVLDWNGDGCDDVIVPRPNGGSLLVLFGDIERTLSCGIEIPLTSAGETIAPYQVVAGALCGDPASSPADLYVIGKRDTDPWLGRWTRDGTDDVSGTLVGGTLPPETYYTPGARPGYASLADLDGKGPPDLLFGDLYSNLISVLGDCGAGFSLIAGRLSMDVPADSTSREVWFATRLNDSGKVFTAGAYVASLHSLDAAGNLIDPTYAPVGTTDGYDAYGLTPNPPEGRIEFVSALEFDIAFSRYDVTGPLFRELDAHATPSEPIGTPDFAFVLDPDAEDGVMSLLFVDTKGNDVGAKELTIHWFPAAAVAGGQLQLGSLVTRRWDKESPAPGFMAQEVFWADLDGSGERRLILLGQNGATQCLEVGESLTACE